MGSTVVKPGKSTSFTFPYFMPPGMGGPHHFEVHVQTNDPNNPTLIFTILADSI